MEKEKPPLSVDEQLIYTTVRISSFCGNYNAIGTGFFFSFDIDDRQVPVIVTNKHVVQDAKVIEVWFTVIENDGSQTNIKKQLVNPRGLLFFHPDENVDLCLILIEGLLNSLAGKRIRIVYLKKENIITEEYLREKISNIEDITILGYPDGIIDEFNNLPIVRRGITATSLKNNFNSKEEFLVDCAIYGGSSGSPVFIFNQGSYAIKNVLYAGDRLFLVGIVYAVAQHVADGTIKIKQAPTGSVPYSETLIPNNLGVVIKACKLLDFEPLFQQIVKNNQ